MENALNAAQKDAQMLYLGNLNTVEFDLTLPTRGANGSSITWETENSRFLTAEGKVNQPPYGRGNRDLWLRAHVQNGADTAEREFTVHILEAKNKIRIGDVRPVTLSVKRGETFHLPAVAIVKTEEGDVIAHPVTWDGGGERCFSKCGKETARGVIAGTEIPVTAAVEVREHTEEPCLRRPEAEPFAAADAGLEPGGPFWDAQCRNLAYLLTVNDDQMLYNFRAAAGLDTMGAPKMAGWDAPESQVRGHTTGHYLSALALCYEATGEGRIRDKAEYMVRALRECQEKFSATPGFQKGFLSGYSEEQFDQLEAGVPYPVIWAPYYTLHKILAGLLDCRRAFGSDEAFTVAKELGLWTYRRLSRLSYEQRAQMWSTYIAGEFGGMNEVLAELYRLTGEKNYLDAARMFDNDKLFCPMAEGVDTLTGVHANQHIPQVIGAMRLFEATGERRYYRLSSHFWRFVVRDHTYVIGGTGEGEMFHQPGMIARLLTDQTAESCASYNMLKLTEELFRWKPDADYMDYYERTVVNHILACGEQRPTGATTYFMPLAPGFRKVYENETENSCCHGTGLENHFKYARPIYFKAQDKLYVNLFINSHVRWVEQGITLQQKVRRERDAIRTALRISGSGSFRLLVRSPRWCAKKAEFMLNGVRAEVRAQDGYFVLDRAWADGDTLECVFPCALRLENAPDDKMKVTVCWGPYVLAALSDSRESIRLGSAGRPLEQILTRQGDEVAFTTNSGVKLIPFYQVRNEKYQIYLSR